MEFCNFKLIINRVKFILTIVGLVAIPLYNCYSQTAMDIVKKADERSRGKSSIAEITIQTVRPNWSREMSMKSWTKGNKLAVVLITAPKKDQGIAFLKNGKEVWNWIPTIERNVKLPPSMMSQSWMGTDFTNDDLVKEASIVEDYDHRFLDEQNIDGRPCYQIEMIPKPNAAVVWGKVLLWIDKKDFMMLRANYFDEDGKLINTLQCSEVKLLGGKLFPTRLEMIPEEKKGNKTVMIYHSLIFDKPIEDRFFTNQNLSKLK
jgi:outer membrane lipoprotein-sorting protein